MQAGDIVYSTLSWILVQHRQQIPIFEVQIVFVQGMDTCDDGVAVAVAVAGN